VKVEMDERGRHASTPDAAPRGRVRTGVPRLDDVLHGGLARGGMYAIVGPPGGGKTVLANQVCFHHVAEEGGRCVVVTLLVESHARLVAHLAPFEFFRPEEVPERVIYVSGYGALKTGGLAELLQLTRRTLDDRRATFLVLDGIESLDHLGATASELREFVNGLQAVTALYGCTTLLLSTLREGHVEQTLVDGVLELSDRLVGPRAVRELTIRKLRGSDHLRGRHELEITSRGVAVHPRTEVRFAAPAAVAVEERVRMPFGIPRLDEMLGGGLLSGSTAAIVGAPGTGKTALGLAFLAEGARRGQRGTYFGFQEAPPRLVAKSRQLGVDLEAAQRSGLVEIVWQPPLERGMDALAEQLLERLLADPQPRRRLFVDGIEGFRAAAAYPARMPRFLSALANELRTLDVTTVVSEELELFGAELRPTTPELAQFVDAVVALRHVELRSHLHRLVSVLKMRESAYDRSIRELRIEPGRLDVGEPFESAEAILSGTARLRPAPAAPATAPRGRAPARPRKPARKVPGRRR
jgi:circadian clock protein KaiC